MEKSINKACASISQTHEFVYNSKPYPFNLKIASTLSNRIEKYQHEFEQCKQIELIKNERIKLSEDSIQSFVSFCQYQEIEITNNNVMDINFLAIEYDIPQLIEITNQYIIQHNELILKQFLFQLNNNKLNKNFYEEAISQRLVEFIEDNDLLKLPISSLYRIIQKNSNLNVDIKFNFLCKCLKKFGKQASTLFSDFDFNGDNKKFLIKLINDPEYSQYFDMSLIKSEIIISLYKQQEKEFEEMKQEFEKYKKNHKAKTICALYITPPKLYANTKYYISDPFDIDFIHKLNMKDVIILVDSYEEEKIIENVKKTPDFFESYDVLIFGNGDSGNRYKKLNYDFFDLVSKYRDNGGSILMLHDFNIGLYRDRNGKEYDIFKKDLGFVKTGNNNPWFMYNKCKFNPKNEKDEYGISNLMSFPYKIDYDQNQGFNVVETHETPILDSQYQIIESNPSGYHYYSENPKKRVADCSMGHNCNLTEIEKKLLFNIIYHLSQLP